MYKLNETVRTDTQVLKAVPAKVKGLDMFVILDLDKHTVEGSAMSKEKILTDLYRLVHPGNAVTKCSYEK